MVPYLNRDIIPKRNEPCNVRYVTIHSAVPELAHYVRTGIDSAVSECGLVTYVARHNYSKTPTRIGASKGVEKSTVSNIQQ